MEPSIPNNASRSGNIQSESPTLQIASRVPAESTFLAGGASQCVAAGPYLVLVGRENGQLAVFDEDGRAIDPGMQPTALGVAPQYVAGTLNKEQFEQVVHSAGVLARALTLGDAEALSLRESLLPHMKKGMLSAENIKKLDGVLLSTLPPDSQLMVSRDRQFLLAVGAETIDPIRIADEEGQSLPFGKWERLPRVVRQSVGVEHVRKISGMSEAAGQGVGVRVSAGLNDYFIQLSAGTLAVYGGEGLDKLKHSAPSLAIAINPTDHTEVWSLATNGKELSKLDLNRLKPEANRPLSFEDATSIDFDPSGNYLLVVAEQGTSTMLHVLDRRTLEEVATVPGVRAPLSIRDDGAIYYVNEDGQLRQVVSNMNSQADDILDTMFDEERRRLEVLVSLADQIEVSVLPPAPSSAREDVDPSRFFEQAGQVIARKFAGPIAEASSVEALTQLSKQLDEVRNRPDFKSYPEVFEKIEEALAQKRNALRLEGLRDNLEHAAESLKEPLTVKNSHEVSEIVADLWRERKKVEIQDRSLRRAIDSQLDGLTELLEQKRKDLQESIAPRVEMQLEELKKLIAECRSLGEIDAFRNEDLVTEYMQLTGELKDDERRTWRSELSACEEERREQLRKSSRDIELETGRRLQATFERLSDELDLVREALKRVTAPSELEEFQASNGLCKSYRRALTALPSELRQLKEEELARLFDEKERAFRQPDAKEVTVKDGVVHFGKFTFPVFPGYSSTVLPKVIPPYPGASGGRLVFEGVGGRLFEPMTPTVSCDLKDPNTARLVIEHREAAVRYFQERTREVPKFQDFWVVNEFVAEQLGELAQYFNMSRRLGKGIVVLEGDAGVGKNILFEMLAHYTNRELFTFACNRKTEKEDLTYAYMYDKERGTYRASSELVEAIQTPGALVIFDEVNTLPVGVTKLLNSLFDHRRSLFMPFGQDVLADPSVIFGAAMNPRHYLGTQDLPYEFVDRGLIMPVGYPPEKYGKSRNGFAPYEAEVIAQYLDKLRPLKRTEFYRAWDHVINKQSDDGVGRFLNREQEASLRDLHYIVTVANRLRSAYSAYQSGKNTDNEVNLVFSLRGAEWIAAAVNLGLDVESAVKKVVLPKAGNPNERMVLEEIIKNVPVPNKP